MNICASTKSTHRPHPKDDDPRLKVKIALTVLERMADKEREYLIRYYTPGADAVAIREDLQIDENEARKIRARARNMYFDMSRATVRKGSLRVINYLKSSFSELRSA